jgi:hypothetical protein
MLKEIVYIICFGVTKRKSQSQEPIDDSLCTRRQANLAGNGEEGKAKLVGCGGNGRAQQQIPRWLGSFRFTFYFKCFLSKAVCWTLRKDITEY